MAWWAILLIVLAVIVAIGLAVGIWWVSTFNKLTRQRNDVKEAYSTMDVYMKKRYDLVPNLVETVKGFAKHEKETLTNVMQARNAAMNAGSTKQKIEGENALTQTLSRLFAVAENYPDLKANQNFVELQKQLTSLENDIAQSRKYYNGCVKIFNTKIEVFPTNLIAGKFKFEKFDLFEVDKQEERQNVQVKF